MGVQNYFFAGLDFIFDRKGRPWFLEANYAPNGLSNVEEFCDKDVVMKAVVNILKKWGRNIAVFRPSRINYAKKENMLWFYDKIKSYVPEARFCYSDVNKRSREFLVDVQGERFKPSAIFRFEEYVNPVFERKMVVINPRKVQKVVDNKKLVLKLAQDIGLKVPKTFVVKRKEEVQKIIDDNPELFEEGYVLKPNNMKEGAGVSVLRKGDDIPRIGSEELMEQRIVPRLLHNRYWDVRTFVVNGRYLGGEMRESRKRVTNISQGAKPFRLPENIREVLRKPSLAIVKAIDEYVSLRKI